MKGWQRLWVFLLLLGWASGTYLPANTWEEVRCCCEQSACVAALDSPAPAACDCEQTGKHTSKQTRCCLTEDHSQELAALDGPTPLPHPELAALQAIQAFCLVVQSPCVDDSLHLGLPAGWVLPHSPPLLEGLINLPPPAVA